MEKCAHHTRETNRNIGKMSVKIAVLFALIAGACAARDEFQKSRRPVNAREPLFPTCRRHCILASRPTLS